MQRLSTIDQEQVVHTVYELLKVDEQFEDNSDDAYGLIEEAVSEMLENLYDQLGFLKMHIKIDEKGETIMEFTNKPEKEEK